MSLDRESLLELLADVGVDGVTEFVGQGGDIVAFALVVDQHPGRERGQAGAAAEWLRKNQGRPRRDARSAGRRRAADRAKLLANLAGDRAGAPATRSAGAPSTPSTPTAAVCRFRWTSSVAWRPSSSSSGRSNAMTANNSFFN